MDSYQGTASGAPNSLYANTQMKYGSNDDPNHFGISPEGAFWSGGAEAEEICSLSMPQASQDFSDMVNGNNALWSPFSTDSDWQFNFDAASSTEPSSASTGHRSNTWSDLDTSQPDSRPASRSVEPTECSSDLLEYLRLNEKVSIPYSLLGQRQLSKCAKFCIRDSRKATWVNRSLSEAVQRANCMITQILFRASIIRSKQSLAHPTGHSIT